MVILDSFIYNSIIQLDNTDIDVTTGGDLRFATNDSTERLRITSNGLVGVNCSRSTIQVLGRNKSKHSIILHVLSGIY